MSIITELITRPEFRVMLLVIATLTSATVAASYKAVKHCKCCKQLEQERNNHGGC